MSDEVTVLGIVLVFIFRCFPKINPSEEITMAVLKILFPSFSVNPATVMMSFFLAASQSILLYGPGIGWAPVSAANLNERGMSASK